MTQKGKEGESENAIGRIKALKWEPTHVTKHTSRVFSYRKENCAGVVRSLGTWPTTAGVRGEKKRGPMFPKINSKY